MSKIVNLRQARKRKTREDASRAGDASAARHGRPRAQKDLDAARRDKDRRDLDGHERER